MPVHFEWDLMRSFLAVMQDGSLGKAAARLGASQPNLGRHVKQLEHQLGVELFERRARSLVPTAFAQRLADAAQGMQHSATDVLRLLEAREADATRTVRITASRMTGLHLLPPLLAALSGVDITLQIDDHVTNLVDREADIAVRLVKPTQQSLNARRVGNVRFGMYAARSYLKKRSEPRDVAELAAHSVIGFDRSQLLLRGARKLGLTLERGVIRFRSDDRAVHWAAVRAGVGIGVLATYLGAQEPTLVRVLPDLALTPSGVWLVALREVLDRPHVKHVFDALRDGLTQVLASAPA